MNLVQKTLFLQIQAYKNCNTFFSYNFQTEMVGEMHALVSSAKPLMTWSAREATQECRDACGGHGFLKAARLGDMRNTVDPMVTYEGDNNVLVQQTSNWLLRQWQMVQTGDKAVSPLGSCNFLKDYKTIMEQRYHTDIGINSNCKFAF